MYVTNIPNAKGEYQMVIELLRQTEILVEYN
jgi:hypothetical protein